MADNSQIPERFPDLSDPRQRHESRDVNIWAISKVGVGLVITTLASAAIVWGLFAYLRVQYNAQPPERGIDVNAMKWPSSPNLLYNVDEAKNQADYRSAEEQTLNGYSWVDQQHTQIKIPISQAIDKLLQKGLPARSQQPALAAGDVSVPTASSLGSKMQQPGGPLASEPSGGEPPPAGSKGKGK
jgi:hypothetical protein